MKALSATAFAPATVANVAVGFDILGFSFAGAGDTVTVERVPESGVKLDPIEGLPAASSLIPLAPEENTATAGLLRLVSDLNLDFGLRVRIKKGIAMGSGMGGSAASAVAAIVAANALLEKPFAREELLPYALIGEAVASGGIHGDNVAPCLLGGLQLIRSLEPMDLVRLPVPDGIHCILLKADVRIETKQARGILRGEVALRDHVSQSANLAGFIAACFNGDLDLLARSLRDVLIEPQRSAMIPAFSDFQSAALGSGALGCSISGSGPAVFALARDAASASRIEDAMKLAGTRSGVAVQSWSGPIDPLGAQIIETDSR